MKLATWMSAIGLAVAFLRSGFAVAGQDETSAARPTAGPHGGAIHAAAGHYCEVVFRPKSLRVYVYDADRKPIDTRAVRGTVTMVVDGNPKRYRYDLYPEATGDANPSCLHLAVDLSRIPDGAMRTTFALYGVADSRGPLRFGQVFRVTQNAEGQAIAAQQICPVSGKPLGSMGAPVRVNVEGHPVYICCRGCAARLKNAPARYLSRLPDPPPLKTTRADAEAVAFQKVCPVTDQPLDAMGGPWKVKLEGRQVFVCCRGCIEPLKEKPGKYLAKLPSPSPTKATAEDAAAIARQKRCPVMNQPLNSMGGPWKVYAKGRPVFVCCKGCIRKVQQNPDLYLAKTAHLKQARLNKQPRKR